MTVAATIEIGAGGRSEPGQGSASERVSGKTSASAGAGAFPATSASPNLPGTQGFRSSWQAQMAVLARERDRDMDGPGTESGEAEGTTDAAAEGTRSPGAQNGSAPSVKTAGMQKPLSPLAESALASAVLSGKTGMASSWTGVRTLGPLQASLAGPPAISVAVSDSAPVHSAKAANTDTEDVADEEKAVLSQKLSKQIKPAASLSPEATAAFSTVPLVAVVQPGAKVNSAEKPSVPADPFNGTTQSGRYLNSQTAHGEAESSAAPAAPQTSNPVDPELKQLHNEVPISIDKETSSTQIGLNEAPGSALAFEGRNRTDGDLGQLQSGTAERQTAPAPAPGQDTKPTAVATDQVGAGTEPAAVPAQISIGQSAAKAGSPPILSAKRSAHSANVAGVNAIALQPQSSAPFGENLSMSRDLSGMPQASNAPAPPNAASSLSSLPETFAALDATQTPGSMTWSQAGARQAEAGFEDPVLGWVGVRANLNGGVHATVLPGSTEAAQALEPHMEGLSAYMAQQHTPVESLAMAAPEDRGASQSAGHGLGQEAGGGTGQGMNQSAGSGTGPGTGQRQDGNAQSQPRSEPESGSALRTIGVDGGLSTASRVQPALSGGLQDGSQIQGRGGVHISVVA